MGNQCCTSDDLEAVEANPQATLKLSPEDEVVEEKVPTQLVEQQTVATPKPIEPEPETTVVSGEGTPAAKSAVSEANPQLEAALQPAPEAPKKEPAPEAPKAEPKKDDGPKVQVDFLVAGKIVSVSFSKRPLGMTLQSPVPGIVKKVVPGGEADKLNVQADWELNAMGGRPCKDFQDWTQLMKFFEEQVAPLPMRAVEEQV